MCRRRNGDLAVFATFADGTIHLVDQAAGTARWTAWRSLEGLATSDPAVAMNADGRLEVFAVGGDRSLVHLWEPEF